LAEKAQTTPAFSASGHSITELQTYGYRPFQDELDKNEAAQRTSGKVWQIKAGGA